MHQYTIRLHNLGNWLMLLLVTDYDVYQTCYQSGLYNALVHRCNYSDSSHLRCR